MTAEEDKLKLQITLDEAKKIFEALGKMPFEEVYELIGKLNEQVNAHYDNHGQGDDDPDQ